MRYIHSLSGCPNPHINSLVIVLPVLASVPKCVKACYLCINITRDSVAALASPACGTYDRDQIYTNTNLRQQKREEKHNQENKDAESRP